MACSGPAVAPDGGNMTDAGLADVVDESIVADGGNGALPLGSVSNVMPNQPCGGGSTTPTCRSLVVRCPGIEDVTAVLQITDPSSPAKGTIFAHLGGGGTNFYTTNVAAFVQNGYRVVQVRWTSDWEKTQSSGILAASCRPATAMQWIFDNVHKADKSVAYCAVGHSGGSGAISYSLAHYGMDAVLDYAQLTAGPPFGRIDYGCAPQTYVGPPRTLCSDLMDAPVALPAMLLNNWENTTTCGSMMPNPAELTKWTADSVVSAGADYDHPKTLVTFWDCTVNPNGTTGGAYFYSQKITSQHTVTCFTQCNGEDLGNAGWNTALQSVIADCKPRH